MRFGHNLKPLNAEIKCIGTAYGDHIKTIKKIRSKLIRKP